MLIIGYFLINHNSFSPFVPTKGAKFVPASGSKFACTRNERKFGCTRHNARLLAVDNMYCFMVLGDLWVVCDYCGVWSIGFNLL